MNPNPPLLEVLRNKNLMSWSLLDRTLLLMSTAISGPIMLFFVLYFYETTELIGYLDESVVRNSKIYMLISFVVALVFVALGFWQRQYRRNWPLLSHAFAHFYVLWASAVLWATGLYTTNGSLILVIGLTSGLLLLQHRVVFYALISGIITNCLVMAAMQMDYINYAPLFAAFPMEGNKVVFIWGLTQFSIVVVCIRIIWFTMTLIIKGWRMREQDLLAQMETQEKLAALGEFSARIIHQTRHQLGLMGISVHNLSQHIAEQKRSGDVLNVEMVKSEIQRLYEIQDKLRLTLKEDLNMQPSGELADQRNYAKILQEEVENLQRLALQRGVVLTLEIGEEQSQHCYPQLTEEWGQGLFNVIENAVSAAHKDVNVQTSIKDGDLHILIRDDGDGIAEPMMKRVLQPFVTSKPDGSGMGLAIADGVAQKEGGRLLLKNREESGLDVIFILPIGNGV
ncbi:MAG: hypothetical protein COA99_07580 [Moraxellaceae bacterium]|nr:MAG: hypothetical protein COA99_07580 [Moraxellaceae bacterium]